MIVAVSGYFDPVHTGHIEYLKLAKALGGRLVVILNTDEQAKQKKGYNFMGFDERKSIVESLWMVDKVISSIDKDGTVCLTLKSLRPDIFAKGGDRFSSEIPEKAVCDELGIEVIDGLGNKIQSSSELVAEWKKEI